MARKPTRNTTQRAAEPEQPDEPEKSPNQLTAEQFAMMAIAMGYPNAKAYKTLAVGGQPVRDGWMVNIRDEHSEMGVVAVAYGRAHFHIYAEFKGWERDAAQVGKAFLQLMRDQHEPAA